MGNRESGEKWASNVFSVKNINEDRHLKGLLEVNETELVYTDSASAERFTWPFKYIRKYSCDGDVFSFEAGRKCPGGEGLYAFTSKQASKIFEMMAHNINMPREQQVPNKETDMSFVNQQSLPPAVPPRSHSNNANILYEGSPLIQPKSPAVPPPSESNYVNTGKDGSPFIPPKPQVLQRPKVIPLSQKESDALRVVLLDNRVNPDEVPLRDSQTTLKKVQQLLVDKGHTELATNLIFKIKQVIDIRKQYLQRLDNLMTDKDTIDLCYLKILLVGPPGVGKTTTLNRLLKAYKNICTAGDKGKRRSTLLANCTQVLAIVNHDNTADWLSSSCGDSDEEAVLLIQYLCGGILKQKGIIDKKILQSQAESKCSEKPYDEETDSSRFNDKPNFPKNPTASKANSLPQHLVLMKEKLRKLVQSGNYTKTISHLGNTLLNINDIGGQPGFLEMLPALSTGPAMYLVFLDLSKELNQPYEITFDRDNTVITPFKSLHTVESTISQILSSIATAHCMSQDSTLLDPQKAAFFGEKFRSFQETQPVAALIGTHLDKLEGQEEKIKETRKSLKKVTQKFSKIVLTLPQNTSAEATSSSPFFSVNNYDGEEAVDIAPIRTFMNEIFQSRFQKASLPIQKKWLILNIILRREYCIAEVKHCFEIGEMLDIDKEEVKFCLWYLNCIGTLMYYTNISDDKDDWFKNHVICSPQVIFDSISQLIITSMCKLHSGVAVTDYEQEELVCKGQFSMESIKMHCGNVQVTEKLMKNELIPAKHLIQLLKHVKLLSPIIHKEAEGEQITYLMPAVLDCATQDELTTQSIPDADNPEPLLITFTCRYVPTGTFCGLITQLVSGGPQGILGLEWGLVEDGVKRNLVSFYVDYVNKVTLICHDRCYEIRVTRNDPKQPLHDLCTYILSVILHNLKNLYPNLIPQIAFRCPCPTHAACRSTDNLCTLVESRTSVRFICGETRVCVDLLQAQQIWLSKPAILGESATLEVLKHVRLRDLKRLSFNWTTVGDDTPPSIDPNRPNVLSFKNVNKEDLDYYKCEVKEAGEVVLTVLRALHRDESRETQQKETSVLSLSGNLTLKEVKKVTNAVRFKWFDMGIELDIDLDKLKDIRSRNHYVVDDCFTEMLSHWLSRPSPPPSWSALAKALTSHVIGHLDIAGTIKLDSEPDCDESMLESSGFTLKEVRKITWDTRSEWRNLGSQLQIDIGTLNALESTSRHVTDDCFTEMLSQWLKRSAPPPSWSELRDALRSPIMGRGDIAGNIETKWGNCNTMATASETD